MGGYDTPRRLANRPFLISTSMPGAVVPRRLDAGQLQTADKPLAAEPVGFEIGRAVLVEQEPSHPQRVLDWRPIGVSEQVHKSNIKALRNHLYRTANTSDGPAAKPGLDGHRGGRLMR